MADILVISVDEVFRGLVGAELVENGYEVEGVDTIEEAVSHLSVTAGLIILEARGQSLNQSSITMLEKLCQEHPVLLCAGPYDLAQINFARFGIKHIAKKPLSLGELVDEAIKLLGTAPGKKQTEDN